MSDGFYILIGWVIGSVGYTLIASKRPISCDRCWSQWHVTAKCRRRRS